MARLAITDLAWAGHELLDAIRSEPAWGRLKKTAASQGGTIPFEVLKALAIQYVKESVGLGPQ